MKKEYNIKSDRYGYVHKLVSITDDNTYEFMPHESWMTLSVVYDENDNIVFVDTDGGPMLNVGWHNDEIEITDIYQVGSAILFLIKEVNN